MSAPLMLHYNAETTWRGGEAQVFLLAQRLCHHMPTAVLCVEGAPLWQRCHAAGITVHAIPSGSGIRALLGLRRLCAQIHPTCIHAHTSRAHQVARIAAPHIPLIVSRRVSFPLRRRFSTAWKYGGVHHFVAVSTAASEALLDLDIDAKRISIIGDGVDEHRFEVTEPIDWSSCGIPADAQVVCNVAALSSDKNHAGLIQAWQQIEAQHPTAHLVIAGTGPCADDLRKQIQTLGLTRVHLLGFRDDIPALLQGSQLFVMNSLNEGLCSSILEAQRCKLPVIATRCGGIPEIVQDGVSGRLVPVGDVQALADALSESLYHPKAAWGEAGFQTSQAYTATAMAQAHLQLYQRLFSDAFPRQTATLGPSR